ncbi:MAG: cupin domain-containing protein [Synergistaceae bacterium]|nr:cupin domain-containing protein [Synergistaceae bacterium]
MLIDFNAQDEKIFEGMNGGTGKVAAKMFMNSSGKVIVSRLKPGSSIGLHTQTTGSDINFVVSGTGLAICDGTEEALTSGVCHYCPKGSSHMINNTGSEDLVLYTVVQEL